MFKKIIKIGIFLTLAFIVCCGVLGKKDPLLYTVTYNINSGTGNAPIDNKEYVKNDIATILETEVITKYGYSFIGWNTLADGTGSLYTQGQTFIMSDCSIVLYANWVKDKTYNVTYDANGGLGNVPVDNTMYEKNSSVVVCSNIDSMTKTNCSFSGWNTATDNSGIYYSASGAETFSITKDTILYAQWTSLPTYKIIYNGNGYETGDVPVDSTNYQANSDGVVLNNIGNLRCSNTLFNSWNTKSDGSGSSYSAGQTISIANNDITLYAQWVESYTIKYVSQGDSSNIEIVDSNQYAFDDDIVVANPDPATITKDGYIFNGWSIESTGRQSNIFPASIISASTYADSSKATTLFGRYFEENIIVSSVSFGDIYNRAVSIKNCIGDIDIPSYIVDTSIMPLKYNHLVTEIKSDSFNAQNITSLYIPASVKLINSSAFSEYPLLTSVQIEESTGLVFGISIFSNSPVLTTCKLPMSTTTITFAMFAGCTSLKNINVIQAYTLGVNSNVTTIESCAFLNCTSLADIKLPTTLALVGSRAFEGCTSLASEINIPASLSVIGENMFKGCTNLKMVRIYGVTTALANSAFANCTSLTAVVFPSGIPAGYNASVFAGTNPALLKIYVKNVYLAGYKSAWPDVASQIVGY